MLDQELWQQIAFFIAGFILLTGGAEFLVRGASLLAGRAGVSPVMIGLTVVAFGTSLPEFLVSLTANLRADTAGEIAIGNIVGSNIANLALILGVAGVMSVIPVDRQLRRREYPLLIGVTILFAVMSWNNTISRSGGIMLSIVLIGFMYYSYTAARFFEPEDAADVAEVLGLPLGRFRNHPVTYLTFVAIGVIALVLGANWLVSSAQFIARAMNVSELVIGLTLVAIGTSLPELATTVVAILRNENEIALGNVIGSNLFNMLFIGGISALIKPLAIPQHMFTVDFPVMIGITILVYVLIMMPPHRLHRWQGALLLLIYVSYVSLLFIQQ